jgi:hypothetical protein
MTPSGAGRPLYLKVFIGHQERIDLRTRFANYCRRRRRGIRGGEPSAILDLTRGEPRFIRGETVSLHRKCGKRCGKRCEKRGKPQKMGLSSALHTTLGEENQVTRFKRLNHKRVSSLKSHSCLLTTAPGVLSVRS